MADLMELAVVVSVPGTDIDLNDHESFEIVDWAPPIQQVRRVAQSGPYQSGRRLISATRDALNLSGTVRVLGSSWSDAYANAESMFSALSQFSYTITVTIDGVTTAYECEPADIAYADGIDGFQVARSRHEYVLSIPCNPPTTGEGS